MSEKKPSKKALSPALKSAGPMDVALLERLVKLMEANDLNMVELRDGDKRVLLKRGGETVAMPMPVSMPMGGTAPPPSSAQALAEETSKLIEIKSPMVGTFYAAASRDAKPLVAVGTAVTEETDVCVIEAMKVFNNVKAECQGTITKILVTNGQAVEFGQGLFLVKP